MRKSYILPVYCILNPSVLSYVLTYNYCYYYCRMCQMARMVDGALPLRGGALVSRLYAHTRHGDPATRALVQRVLDSVCAPLYTVLSRCVTAITSTNTNGYTTVMSILLSYLF